MKLLMSYPVLSCPFLIESRDLTENLLHMGAGCRIKKGKKKATITLYAPPRATLYHSNSPLLGMHEKRRL